jgi:hypothetical protein
MSTRPFRIMTEHQRNATYIELTTHATVELIPQKAAHHRVAICRSDSCDETLPSKKSCHILNAKCAAALVKSSDPD